MNVDLTQVRDQRALQVRITPANRPTELCTSRRRKGIHRPSPLLPEPPLTTRDVADDIELADSVPMAIMVVLPIRLGGGGRKGLGRPAGDVASLPTLGSSRWG